MRGRFSLRTCNSAASRANHILDIKNTFYDMHPRLDAKRGIMQARVLEKMRAEGSKTPFDPETERTAFGER
jgi:hypothetical protein